MINLIFRSGHTHGTGLDGGADPALGSEHSSCSCTWGAWWGWGSWVPVGSPWLCSSLGGKNRGFGSFSCWKGAGAAALEPLHAHALPPTHMHIGLCQMCSHTGAGTCVHMCSHSHVCVGTHVHIAWSCDCTDTQLCTRVCQYGHVHIQPCTHPRGHTHCHICAYACRYTSPWSHTHVPMSSHAPCSLSPAPCLPRDLGCPWGRVAWGGGRRGQSRGLG